jgi:two-component system, sensor histidine kinase PdtaS
MHQMNRGLIIIVLLANALHPCIAQQMLLKPIDEIRTDLKQSTTDTGKANQLLNLALSYVYKPGEIASDLDSALLLVRQAQGINANLHNKKIEAKSYFVYSNALREKGNMKLGREYIEKSLAVYKTISEPDDMGEAWHELGMYYSAVNEEINMKKECYEKALTLFRTSGNKQRQGDLLKDIGDFDQIQGNYIQAMKELREALSIYQSIDYKNLQGVYGLLGKVGSDMGDYPGAVKYGLLAVKVAEDTKDSSLQLATVYSRLGVAYSNWPKNEEAVTYLKKALVIALKYNKDGAIKTAILQLIYRFYDMQRWKESLQYARLEDSILKKPLNTYDSMFVGLLYGYSYLAGKQYARAELYTHELKILTEKYPEDALHLVGVYRYFFYYFMAMEQYAEAKKYASTYLSISLSIKVKKNIAIGYLIKSRADSALGNFQAALSGYQSYKNLTDSMLNETSSFQFAQQEVEYETEKKDDDIKLLKQQEEIQKTKLIESRTTNSIVLASITVLVLLLALLYSSYRNKQRHSRQLETKQQEINEKNKALEHLITDKDNLIADKDVLLKEKDWLVKEIHHRVKNNLQMVISLLNAQSDFLSNPSALDAIRESRERMQAIAIIHQKLYQAENSTKTNMRSYINELVENIRNSIPDSKRIYFNVDVADIDLDISQSVPLGLILNEAITNVIKYAYPENQKGDINISLQYKGIEKFQLRIADHGKGFPPGINADHSNSLGLQLIRLFSEQLEGELLFINNHGLEIILNFNSIVYNDAFNGKTRSVTI